jgi:hypothetical protein
MVTAITSFHFRFDEDNEGTVRVDEQKKVRTEVAVGQPHWKQAQQETSADSFSSGLLVEVLA